ncbi:hypothetical protein [Peribacillus kribbensis]|nr:hypothetical protein [Peribacillus kribbensis]
MHLLLIADEPSEPDNFLKWIEPAKALNLLFHEHQSWAVSEALEA